MDLIDAPEGSQITEVKGVIIFRKKGHDTFSYILTDGEQDMSFEIKKFLQIGEEVKLSGIQNEDSGKTSILKPQIEIIEGVYAKVLAKTEENVKTFAIRFLASGEIVDKLHSGMIKTAKKILTAKKMNRYTLLRFHNDADGISGALAITKILKKAHTYQQNSANYSISDSKKDIGRLRSEKNPLVILVDFACGKGSTEGLSLLKSSDIEILIIDHHPNKGNAEKNCNLLVNPWTVSSDENTSSYTAGYLASEISRMCGEESAVELTGVACAGDKSKIIPIDAEDVEMAGVLDYMASNSAFGNKLSFYRNAFENKEFYSSVLIQANESLEQIKHQLKMNTKKRYDGAVSVYTIDTEKIKNKDFPGKGKITTLAFELIDGPAIVLGTWKNGLSFRITSGAIEKGVNATALISELKKEMPDFILGGGGHARAASLLIQEGFVNSVVEKIIDKTKQIC